SLAPLLRRCAGLRSATSIHRSRSEGFAVILGAFADATRTSNDGGSVCDASEARHSGSDSSTRSDAMTTDTTGSATERLYSVSRHRTEDGGPRTRETVARISLRALSRFSPQSQVLSPKSSVPSPQSKGRLPL